MNNILPAIPQSTYSVGKTNKPAVKESYSFVPSDSSYNFMLENKISNKHHIPNNMQSNMPSHIHDILDHMDDKHLQFPHGGLINLDNSKKTAFKTGGSDNAQLYNLAPMAKITSVPNSRNLNNLLAPRPVPSRIKNVTWVHLLSLTDKCVTLDITLPSYVLLHEVVLHSGMPLSAAPASVCLSLGPHTTSHHTEFPPFLSPLVLKLHTPTVVNSLSIQLYKHSDTTSVGLMQIELIGSTTFKGES